MPSEGSIATQIEHVGIVVRDLDAAQRFFCDLLGLELLRRWRSEKPPAKFVMLDAGNTRLELLAFDDSPDEPWYGALSYKHLGLRHLTFAVDDVDNAWATIQKAGYSLVIPPRQGSYYRRFMFCRGPEEILIELVEA